MEKRFLLKLKSNGKFNINLYIIGYNQIFKMFYKIRQVLKYVNIRFWRYSILLFKIPFL